MNVEVSEEEPRGVLVVDKPEGPTSHDIVMQVRRALRTKRVGHAGTLDPMATGVLVVLIGECTKLEPYLSGAHKTYEATVRLGVTTTSLDATGEIVEQRELHDALIEELLEGSSRRVEAALAALRSAETQVPPAVSAIHVDGKRSYDLAREGKAPNHAPRPTRALTLTATAERPHPPEIDLTVHATKGFYVRSLARDLGELLGSGAHLSKLRRIASGAFSIDEACSLAEISRERLIPIGEATRRSLPAAVLTADAVLRARQGKKLSREDFVDRVDGRAAWFDGGGVLVAIGEPEGETWRVLRGFTAAWARELGVARVGVGPYAGHSSFHEGCLGTIMAFPGPQILLAVGFAALSALMRATDTALTSLSTSRIAALLEQEPKHAASLRRWQASSHSMRASYVVGAVWAVGGTSIASFDAVSTLLPSAPETLHMVLAVLATLVLVAPAAFIGVSIALREPEIWGPKLATFLRVFEWVFWPIAKPIAHVAEWIAEKWSPEVLPEQAKSLTSAEVEYLVDEVERAGVVSAGPAEMLRNVLEFEELSVRDVMVARTKVEAIDISMPLAKVRELVAESGHSRYPVYEGDLDEVVGLLVAKDVFKAEARSDTNLSLGDVVRSDVIFVHEAQSLASVLREMRLKRQHMAVVVDEFGGTSGVATLEDVIERIVGDIRDEHDDAEGAPIQDLNGRLFALPTTPFGDVSAYLGVGIAESLRDASVGALLLDAHPQPKPGHSTEHHGVRLVVRGVAGNEIQRIEVIRLELDEDAPPKSEEREAS